MIICPACKHVMLGEPVLCTACGRVLSLAAADIEDTVVIESMELRTAPKPQKVWRSAEVGRDKKVELRINGEIRTVTIAPDEVLVLGRADSNGVLAPDVDLSAYGALERGVSRLHAALRLDRSMLTVKDMSSTNGTFVNGQRVSSQQWRVVRDLDELRLGKLPITLRLESQNQNSGEFAPTPSA